MNEEDIIKCDPNKGYRNISNLSFGYWNVLEYLGVSKKNKYQHYWKCCCQLCNTIHIVDQRQLISNKTSKCKQCANKKFIGCISGHFYSTVRYGAKIRSLEFSISQKDMFDLWQSQNGKCNLSKLSLFFADNQYDMHHGIGNASLDRIDNSCGYTINNIQFLHKEINLMKWKLKQNEFISLCKEVYKFGNIFLPREIIITKKHPYFRGCGNIPHAYWGDIIKSTKRKNYIFNITIEEAWNLYIKQYGRCYFTGLPIVFSDRYIDRKLHQTASLDRLNNNQGYDIQNCVWVHKNINFMKHCRNVNDFKYYCQQVAINN